MLAGVLSALPRSRARHLLDQGFWLSGREGDVLTREEEVVTHLFYLSSGEARVMSHGKRVGTCHAGDLIGEVTVLSGDEASATVLLEGTAHIGRRPCRERERQYRYTPGVAGRTQHNKHPPPPHSTHTNQQ